MKTVVLAFAVLSACGGSKASSPLENSAASTLAPAPRPDPVDSDSNTGLALYVHPPNVTSWKFDGERRYDHLPARIHGIVPGHHRVEIEPPAGFVGAKQDIEVEAGTSQTLIIELLPAP
ncbi:hypothetical protein BH11MYX2_BH11MYX2_05040 [soil metagenome]